MTKTVVGVYESLSVAHQVIHELVNAGFDRNQLSLVANDANNSYAGFMSDNGGTRGGASDTGSDVAKGAGIGAALGGLGGLLLGLGALAIPGVGPVIAAGPLAAALTGAGIGAATGGMVGALADLGIPDEEANIYSESVRRGNVLVVAQVTDSRVNEAARIMESGGLVDIDRHAESWRSEGWRHFDATSQPYSATATTDQRTAMPRQGVTTGTTTTRATSGQNEETFEIVEEDIKIGKRAVQEGGVRVRSFVREIPVEEEVRLREEEVHVERRPVNRPATAADLSNFREGTVEMTEMHEEAVIGKEARVVEEVTVRKDVTEHVERIHDTVRRTEVEVEQIQGGATRSATGISDYSVYESDFRTHFNTNFGQRGGQFNTYQPAYRYGHTLASDNRYQGRQWRDIETDARRDWESRNPNSRWDDVKDAIQYSWSQVRGRS